MGYSAPNAPVSADWSNHKNRNPPSSEPGTDYAVAYGTKLYAAGDGQVIETKTTNSNATGRYCAIALYDGRSTRDLHMAEVDVKTGQYVDKGQYIGLSGASGYNSNYYYGPHVHRTLWPGKYWANPTIDFELYAGNEPEPKPPEEKDDEMAVRMMHWTGGSVVNVSDKTEKVRRAIWSEISGQFAEWTESGSTYANNMSSAWETNGSAQMTESLANAIYQSCLLVRPKG